GEFITAARAYEIGLYNKVVAQGALESEANAWAARLAAGPTMGLAMTKRMLNLETHMPLAAAMQTEGWIQAECMKHPDYREAYEAATAKRPPDFTKHDADGAKR